MWVWQIVSCVWRCISVPSTKPGEQAFKYFKHLRKYLTVYWKLGYHWELTEAGKASFALQQQLELQSLDAPFATQGLYELWAA